MKIITTYSAKIKHYNHIFKETVAVYRQAVDFLMEVFSMTKAKIFER
jgi:hypothetical protein